MAYRPPMDSAIDVAVLKRDVEALRSAVEKHDEQLGKLGAEVSIIGKDVAVIRCALEPLIDRPSKIEHVRAAMSTPPPKAKGNPAQMQLLLIGGLVAAIEIISKLVNHLIP